MQCREQKETIKLRVMFDASAHAPDFLSIHEQLYAGEHLVSNLLAGLLNFRFGKIGLMADIEKAFLKIELNENERNSHTLQWYVEPINKNNAFPNIREYRMKQITFGVIYSPFLLDATKWKPYVSSRVNKIQH
ncbi:hypothetical protein NQ314_000927 [Rhamnusium bicolor]|uniref:Uncharacterized protein n=1 Tax=Rhamnusium bicolor TaxID=1586634 RepID=A0AAV8ZTU2_9CUCU|nr:hypothetical protein NQ314_000927 [Rhamnusium bicolor]